MQVTVIWTGHEPKHPYPVVLKAIAVGRYLLCASLTFELCLQGQDLASGNLTAPAIFALACEGSERLRELIESEFLEEDDLAEAMHIIKEGDGLAAARRLARQESDLVR